MMQLYNGVDFPGGSDSKASVYNVGDLGSIPGLGRSPWRRKWQPTPVLLPGKSHGWMEESGGRQSMGSHRELDTTEQLHFKLNWPHRPNPVMSTHLHILYIHFQATKRVK